MKIGKTMGVLHLVVWTYVNYANMEDFRRDSHILDIPQQNHLKYICLQAYRIVVYLHGLQLSQMSLMYHKVVIFTVVLFATLNLTKIMASYYICNVYTQALNQSACE